MNAQLKPVNTAPAQPMIEVLTTELETRNSKATGKPYHKQQAFLHVPGSRYPTACKLFAEDGKAFAPGMYFLAASSFRVGQYGDLEIRPVLVSATA
jgi:hypothetical protein